MNLLKTLARNELLTAFVLSMGAFGVYLTTVCPTVSFTDSGELAAVAVTLGIAHPTGYPLFTLLARLVAMVPLYPEEIMRLNVFAALVTAAAVGMLFRLVLILLRSKRVFQIADGGTQSWKTNMGAAVGSLVFAFSSTVWSQSVGIEVYSLHLLLIILTTMFFVDGLEEQLSEPSRTSRRLLLFSLLLGLAFANHMTTVLLAPAFLYLYFRVCGSNKKSWRRIITLSPFFLLGLSIYLYLPIRSGGGVALDWGHPATLERFLWHLTGKQYQVWMFAGWSVAMKQLNYFITNFPTEFRWPVIALLGVGVVEMALHWKRLFLFVAVLFGSCVLYSINYDIHDIDSYFLLAYLACACFMSVGTQQILGWKRVRDRRVVLAAAIVIIAALPFLQAIANFQDVDQSQNYVVRDFTQDILKAVEPNAVVFSTRWDYFVSPSYYYQMVRKERPDIHVIDKSLLQNRTWYFMQLARNSPEIAGKSRRSIESFLVELNKFERGIPFRLPEIQARWNDLLKDIVEQSLPTRPVYVDPGIESEFSGDFDRVPEGLLIRLVRKGEHTVYKPITRSVEGWRFKNNITNEIRQYYAAMHTYHGLWLKSMNRLPEAMEAAEKALQANPMFAPAAGLKAQLAVAIR